MLPDGLVEGGEGGVRRGGTADLGEDHEKRHLEELRADGDHNVTVIGRPPYTVAGLTAAAEATTRAVARRAERDFVRLLETEEANPHAGVYLNRLSDLLFIMARAANARSGVQEEAWLVKGRR